MHSVASFTTQLAYENIFPLAYRRTRNIGRGMHRSRRFGNALWRAHNRRRARSIKSFYPPNTFYPHAPDNHPYARSLLVRHQCASGDARVLSRSRIHRLRILGGDILLARIHKNIVIMDIIATLMAEK